MTDISRDGHKRILLLNCDISYCDALRNKKHSVQTGNLCWPVPKPRGRGIKIEHHYPPLYESEIIVCSPQSFRTMPSYEMSFTNDLSRAMNSAGVVVITFFNRVPAENETAKLPFEMYRLFLSGLVKKDEKDTLTEFSDNEVSQMLKPILEPLLKNGKVCLPLVSFNVSGQSTPIMVNRAGDMHAAWVRKGKGGILFLPEFEDNLEILKALLELPIRKLLEYRVASPQESASQPENEYRSHHPLVDVSPYFNMDKLEKQREIEQLDEAAKGEWSNSTPKAPTEEPGEKIVFHHGLDKGEFNNSASIGILKKAEKERGKWFAMKKDTLDSFRKRIQKKLPEKQAKDLLDSIEFSQNRIKIKKESPIVIAFVGFSEN